jgi:ClpP class serine protease
MASGASKIYIASETTRLGSIGVISRLRERRIESDSPFEITENVLGKFKDFDSPYREPEPDLTDYKGSYIEHIYQAFVTDIAKFRGVSLQTVLETMADGRIFQGSQAINAGLADGFYSLTDYHLHGNVKQKNNGGKNE